MQLSEKDIKRLNTLRTRIAADTEEVCSILGKAGEQSQPSTGKRKVLKHERNEKYLNHILRNKTA